LQQAEEMGWIKVGSKPLQGEWKILGLTPEGHDFLTKQGELITAKPNFWGVSIDLNACPPFFGFATIPWRARS